MGFWNKLGKIALTAAPYVAAPFTGGASLAATGLANKAVQKWSQKDAEKAMAKGLAPSKFDSVLGKVGNIASTASMFIPGGQLGAIGKAGSTGAKLAGTAGKLSNFQKIMGGVSAATGGSYNPNRGGGGTDFRTPDFNPNAGGGGGWQESLRRALNPDMQITGYGGGTMRFPMGGQQQGGGWQDALGGILGGYGRQALDSGGGDSGGGYSGNTPDYNAPSNRAVPRQNPGLGPVMPRGGYRYRDNPMNQLDQSNPNLAQSIFQGRQEAIRSQPFRGGYDVNTLHQGMVASRITLLPLGCLTIYPNGGGGRRRRGQQQEAAY